MAPATIRRGMWHGRSLSVQGQCGTLATMEGFSFEAFTRVRDKGNTHEEDTDGGGGRGHAGGFDGFACLCLARRLGSGYWPRLARRRHHWRRDRLQPLSVRLLRPGLLLWRPRLCR